MYGHVRVAMYPIFYTSKNVFASKAIQSEVMQSNCLLYTTRGAINFDRYLKMYKTLFFS